MLMVGSLSYAGNNYLLQFNTNSSKMRIILFDLYSKEQRERIDIESDDEIREALLEQKLDPKLLRKPNVRDLQDYVVGAVQSDKRASKSSYLGDTFLIHKFMSEYEFITNFDYKENDDTRVTLTDYSLDVDKSTVDEYISMTKEKEIGNAFFDVKSIKFSRNNITFSSLFVTQAANPCAPVKGWEWTEDVDFNNHSFKRNVISLFAKSLAQLRQEKDLSWYFNTDGTPKKNYRILHTMEEVREVVAEIEKLQNVLVVADKTKVLPVALDCETTGLLFNSLPRYNEQGDKNPLKDEIGGMSLSWRLDQGIYIPFLHTKFQNVDRDECLTFLKPYLEKWYLETHNGLFDGKVFLDYGIKLNIQDDSMIMLFNINPTVAKGSKGLKENTLTRYGHETLDHDDVFPSKKDVTSYYDLSEDIVKIYACADTDYTHRLCTDLRSEVPSVRAYRLDIKVMRYLIKVNYNGNKVDEVLLNGLSKVVDEDIVTLEEVMYKFVGQVGQLTQATRVMEQQVKYGNMTADEIPKLIEELKHEDSFKNARYEFSPSKPDVLVDILYNKLGYPITRVNKTSGKPTADKYALKDLAKEVLTESEKGSWLKEDIMSASIRYSNNMEYGDKVLISADTFNSMKYPFVMLLQKWKDLMKLKTTFFAWFLNGSCDNMYYSDFSMTNAETSRIIGRIQTLKGAMKQLIVPFSDEYYLMGVDFSQIEARLMAYLAGKWDLVERLCNPRADYHVESAAMLTGKESWQISKSERGELKSVNFAVPYGMAEFSLAENLYGRPVTADKVEKARVLLAVWKKSNWEIQALLDSYRKFAKEEHDIKMFNSETRTREVTPTRLIVNKFGRRRLFNSGKYEGHYLEPKVLASIDRMAGNFPIQSYAAEIFKTAFVNINKRLEKEGLDDKVFITALVHDEFLMNVHRSVDKYKLYEILWEEMVQNIYLPKKDEGGNWLQDSDGNWDLDREHPVKFFFAGISIGPEWHDIHGNDAHEAPTEYLTHMVDMIKSGEYKFKEYESGNVTEDCFNETKAYMRDVFFNECKKLQPDIRPDNVKFYKIVPAFFDYFLKGRLKIYQPNMHRAPEKGSDADEIRARLETLLMDLWNVSYLYCYDNEEDEVWRMAGTFATTTVDGELPDIDAIDLHADDVVTDDIDFDSDSLADMGDIFGDLFDEDLDNLDDDYEDFNISIPVAVYQKDHNDEYNVVARRTSPDDKRDIWDLVDFKAKINSYDAKEEAKYSVRSDSIYINVTDCDFDKVQELLKYLNSQSRNKGIYSIKLKYNSSIKDTGLMADFISRQKVYDIMGWGLVEALN